MIVYVLTMILIISNHSSCRWSFTLKIVDSWSLSFTLIFMFVHFTLQDRIPIQDRIPRSYTWSLWLTEKCIFLQVSNLQIKLFFHFSNESVQLFRRLKKSNEKNFSEAFDTRACFDMMLNQWKTSYWEEGFWNVQTQWSKSCSLNYFF